MKLKHFDHDGQARFITFCTHKRLPLLTNNSFRKIVIDSIASIRNIFNFELIAYVIMPEHVHLIILPTDKMLVGYVIGEIKKVSAKRIHHLLSDSNSHLNNKLTIVRNKTKRFVFWQRRCYDHNIRSEESLWEKVNYCHYNPVKRGLVRSPELWQWSSYRWYQGYRDVLLKIDVSEKI